MATPIEISDVLEMFVMAGLKGEMINGELAKQIWADVEIDVLKSAAIEYIKTAKFMPTFAELTPFIQSEIFSHSYQDNTFDETFPELMFRVELWRLAMREPECERCEGMGCVTDEEKELTVKTIREAKGNLFSHKWKACPADCIAGHVPALHKVAALRSRIFKTSQSTTNQREQTK